MSMFENTLHEAAALVISEKLADLIVKQAADPEMKDMTKDELEEAYGSVQDAAYEILNDKAIEGLCFASYFYGKVSPLKVYEDDVNHDITVSDEDVYYIQAKKEPSLFEAAYANLGEIVAEFREKLESAGFDLTGVDLESSIYALHGTFYA